MMATTEQGSNYTISRYRIIHPGPKEKDGPESTQPIEKVHSRQDYQRKSKPFPLIVLAGPLPDFAGFG
jgi:hypothetical protein